MRVLRLIALAVSLVALAGAPTAGASFGTVVSVFHAFSATGTPSLPTKPASGYCWTGSLTADRTDAWRCFVGNLIYDPCFSSKAAPDVVLCPNAALSDAVEIHLTRPLPPPVCSGCADLRPHDQPWLIELDSTPRTRCEFESGATNAARTPTGTVVRLNYFCTGGEFAGKVLWGYPIRREPEWRILMTPPRANNLAHATPAPIRHVWM